MEEWWEARSWWLIEGTEGWFDTCKAAALAECRAGSADQFSVVCADTVA